MDKRNSVKETGEYKVVVKSIQLNQAESEIRIRRAFGCVFHEVLEAQESEIQIISVLRNHLWDPALYS